MLHDVVRWFATEHRMIAASAIRVGLGVVLLSLYLLHYPYRHFLWGPEAFLPYALFAELNAVSESWSVYRFARTPLAFELIFHAGLAVTLLWVAGLWTRITGLLTYVFAFSLWERNGFILDGGDNILIIVLFYLLLCRTDAHFSLARALRGGDRPVMSRAPRWWTPLPTILHNAGMVAIVLQVGVLYLTSGLMKVQGEMWQSGVALYYILRVDEFTLPGVAEHVYQNMWLIVALTYVTVLEQVSYPFMLLNKWTKRLSVFIVVQMHLGIALVMGLITFSTVMITLQAAAFNDDELRGAARWVKGTVGRAGSRLWKLRPRIRPREAPALRPAAGGGTVP
jgi:hypothetical protein